MAVTDPSYVHGASGIPLLPHTVGASLSHISARMPEADALIVPHQGIRWKYQQLDEIVDRVARGFWRSV